MTFLIGILAAAVFLFGGITGVLATLAIGIHTHSRTKVQRTHIDATRRILGVGPINEADYGKQQRK